ncbi:hypothetical protein [Dokdonia sp.]|uniref:hypothetical protein n=1 Tax=Dokdonia sp. TaxID=2024995 RepID=UPI0032670FEB
MNDIPYSLSYFLVMNRDSKFHNIPVVFGFITEAIEWKYPCAKNFTKDHTIVEIDDIGFIEKFII